VETRIYTDKAGRTVLKRQVTGIAGKPYYDTYYVYNMAGMVSIIIPPEATHLILTQGYTITSTQIVNLIYTYGYNSLGQDTSRTAPGNITTSVIYDPLHRPVLTQDANMALTNHWNYIKYDVKGRIIMSGAFVDNTHTTVASMQNYVNGLAVYKTKWYESRSTSATYYYYTNNVFPTSTSTTPLNYSYYDNYNWDDSGGADFSYKAQTLPATGPEGQPIPTPVLSTDTLQGIPTMSITRSVGPGLSNIWLMKVVFYDHYGRPIQVQSNNQLEYSTPNALSDTATVTYDFVGKPMANVVKKVIGTTPAATTVLTTMNYDADNSRLMDIDQKYNSQANIHIAHYNYNEIGQLITKNLGYTGTKWLQNVYSRYSIRGQLLTINNSKLNNDLGVTTSDSTGVFGMQVMYDKPDPNIGAVQPSYSGRISAVKWMSRDIHGNRTNERSYAYSYDYLGRYTGSTYAERTVSGTATFNQNVHGFDESGITYDENGNLHKLKRNSSAVGGTSYNQVDSLTYTYDSNKLNQLNTVTDGTGSNYTSLGFRNLTGSTAAYAYDADGNLTNDPYKGISIGYNGTLNKPDTISGATLGTITYTYDGSGNLLRKRTYNTSGALQLTTDYIDNFVYTTTGSTHTLSYLSMPEGRIVNTGSSLTAEYVISDQQGNARFSFQDNGSGAVKPVQENSYYAFGEVLANSTVSPLPATPNINLYNGGSEWQNELSNNMPDYHMTFYRNYDPAIARFVSVDPMPESAESLTTYQYAGNNPVMYNDPLGDLYDASSSNGSIPSDPDAARAQLFYETFGYNYYGGGAGGFGGIPNNDRNDFSEFWEGTVEAQSGLKFNNSGKTYQGQYHLYDPKTHTETITSNYLSTDTYGIVTHQDVIAYTPPALDDITESHEGYTTVIDQQNIVELAGDAGNALANMIDAQDSPHNYSPFRLFGITKTVQNGILLSAQNKFYDKIEFKGYKEQTITGKEGLFNTNHVTFIDQSGIPHQSTEWNMSTGYSKVTLSSEGALTASINVGDFLSINAGDYGVTGVTIGGSAAGHGFEASGRAGLGTLAAVGAVTAIAVLFVGGAALVIP